MHVLEVGGRQCCQAGQKDVLLQQMLCRLRQFIYSVCKWCGTLLESIPKGPIFVLPDQVLESPNSSYAWIRYMAHHMGVGEIDKARGVAERALKTINFRCSPRPFFFSLSRAFACPL